jgi:hypothetical protein
MSVVILTNKTNMNAYSSEQIARFFSAINPWRPAYSAVTMSYLAYRRGEKLFLLSARIYLEVSVPTTLKARFLAGSIECGQLEISRNGTSLEQALEALLSPEGLTIEGHGTLLMPSHEERGVSVSTPMLLHHEGVNNGNRLGVLSIHGAQRYEYLPQPETDWILKAGVVPYDHINELSSDYGLGPLNGDSALIEVIALTAIQVLARSEVKESSANIGVWMSAKLDKAKAKIGYRVIDKGNVVLRGAKVGEQLAWEDKNDFSEGLVSIEVPAGSIVQCIASYEGLAHHIQWRADPTFFQNPRTAILNSVDQTGALLRAYLMPDLPPKGKAADDFEAAINWVLWALGFAPANFGLNNKTRDAFDTIAVTPSGDFLVIECTLGLLRAESKLSKLAARAASLRASLDASDMTQIRILPIIITAMTREQVKADLDPAESAGLLVLTRENLEEVFNEMLRFPDADNLFERGIRMLKQATPSRDLFTN